MGMNVSGGEKRCWLGGGDGERRLEERGLGEEERR
jgi:hypothetical protein